MALSLRLFLASLSRQSWRGKCIYTVCALTCAHTYIQTLTSIFISTSTFICWNICIYTRISNSNPIRVINLVFCLSIFLTPSNNRKPGLFSAYLISLPVCKDSPTIPTTSPAEVPRSPCPELQHPTLAAPCPRLPHPAQLWPSTLSRTPSHPPHPTWAPIRPTGPPSTAMLSSTSGFWATALPLRAPRRHLALLPDQIPGSVAQQRGRKRRIHTKVWGL